MANKQKIDGVSRELLERIAAEPRDIDAQVRRQAAVDELRALLDKPAYPGRLCHADKGAHPYICGCLKGDAEAQRRFDDHHSKAAQHHGDTVERLKQVNNKQWRALIDMRDERDTLRALLEEHQFQYKPYDDHYHRESGYYCVGCGDEKGKHVDNTCHIFIALTAEKESVVAEQPAPVADHPQCEECKGWGYHENHHEGGGTECGECGGSGKATVAVFMPERMYSDSLPSWAEEQKLVRGWNACLEEVSRLNEVKP
ncbi:MAG: hypothetical protein [Bacteriophage sp.]|nr:MAG: hypothetical protein [Bacteriophage sp.]